MISFPLYEFRISLVTSLNISVLPGEGGESGKMQIPERPDFLLTSAPMPDGVMTGRFSGILTLRNLSQGFFSPAHPPVGAAFPEDVDGLGELLLGTLNVFLLLEPVGIIGMIRCQLPPHSIP